MRISGTLTAVLVVALVGSLTGAAAQTDELPPVGVSEDGRSFTAGGEPFLWLGDRAGGLLLGLDGTELERYLDVRAEQGFSVVHTAVPAATAGDDWQPVDLLVAEAAERGLRVAMSPEVDGLTPATASAYGEFLGGRYGDRVAWVLGAGSGPADAAVWGGLAGGIGLGRPGTVIAFAPGGSTADLPVVDALGSFTITGNDACPAEPLDELIAAMTPPRPVLNGRVTPEDGPACGSGRNTALDVRRSAYGDVFAGAGGHIYGHHALGSPPDESDAARTAALTDDGAGQLRHLRALVDSRPSRLPAPALLGPESLGPESMGPESMGMAATDGTRVLSAVDDGHLMVYAPAGEPFALDTTSLTGDALRGWWFDPRTGTPIDTGTVARGGSVELFPPATGPADAGLDWVLVVDDAALGLPPPGRALPAGS